MEPRTQEKMHRGEREGRRERELGGEGAQGAGRNVEEEQVGAGQPASGRSSLFGAERHLSNKLLLLSCLSCMVGDKQSLGGWEW